MRQLILIGAALALWAGTGPVAAQNSGISGGGYGGFNSVGGGPDYGGPPPSAYRRPVRTVCVTAAGDCLAGSRQPGSRCGCAIPGRGERRGIVR